MNYLPVKSFDFDNPITTFAGIILVVSTVVAILFLLLMDLAARKKRERVASIFSGLAFTMGIWAVLGMLVGGASIFYDLAGFNRLNERNDKAQAQIEKTYDLKLSSTEFVSLNYPQIKPKGDFAVYGSIQKDVRVDGPAFRSVKLSLVWSEGKFYLSESTNGEDFQPLRTKR